MARKPRKRRTFNLRKVRIASSTSIGALATLDVTSGTITNAPTDKIRFISVDLAYSWSDKTPADDGLEFGLAHGDYSAAEIEECLEAQSAIDVGDKTEQERADRLVRTVGIISGGGDGVAAAGGSVFNDGKPMKTKLNWLMGAGDQLQVWVRNGSATVYTTGGSILTQGNLWVKD